MKIRRYVGKDSQEVMSKVKGDLGSDAIILNTRKVKQKGILNLFSKPLVEILAAVDEDAKKSEPRQTLPQATKKNLPQNQPPPSEPRADRVGNLESTVKNMEQLLQKIYKMQTDPSKLDDSKFPKKIAKILQVFEENLRGNGVEEKTAKNIIHEVGSTLSDEANVNDIAARLYYHIYSMIGKPEPINLIQKGKPTVVLFVGSTGVGKTTTLAKIAADFSINLKKNLGIISSDTYRIAAVDQLKTYADILSVELGVVYSPQEIQAAIAEFSNKDLILIDTAGRGYKNLEQFAEIRQIVEQCGADEFFLLIAATTDYNVCSKIIKNYDFMNDYKIILTKMDEISNFGIILNIRNLTDKKFSYITTGQSVPDDIELLNVDKISKKLLGSVQYE